MNGPFNTAFGATCFLVSNPSGLPPGAIAYADFKNGTYYYGGNALSDFLVQDNNWGVFDPASIVPGVGFVNDDSHGQDSPALASALNSQVIAAGGFTAVCDVRVNAGGGITIQMAVLPSFAEVLLAEFGNAPYATDLEDPDGATNGPVGLSTTALHRVAATITPSHLAGCVDGGTVFTRDPTGSFGYNSCGFNFSRGTWEKIVFYPIKLDADLPALSA